MTDSIRTTVPLRVGQRSKDQRFNEGLVQDVRVYTRRLNPEEVRTLAQSTPAWAILELPDESRSQEQRDVLLDYYLNKRDAEYVRLKDQLIALEAERETIRKRSPLTHIQQERTNSPAMAYVLFRGRYDQPKDRVEAKVFDSLNPLPPNAPHNRLGLAQWLVSPHNPLTARVTVNRFWQEIFGVGLVKTAEDFGIMGELPSNQELLDWLAVEFRESGWNVKQFFRLIVTSSTYRQSAVTTPEKIEKDPANRLLSRGPRFRMDAEMVRDYALAASGLLRSRVGGPSVKPYQPEGVWEAVAMPESNTRVYARDEGEALYRRSLYTFWKRSAPPTSMDIFNAPSREVACPRRERTDTPLQALVTMNDVQMIEAARHLSELALKETGGKPQPAVDIIANRLLARVLNPEEAAIVRETLDLALEQFQSDPAAAKQLIAVGESKADPGQSPQTLAALTVVANQLFNLDEVLNK